MYRKEESNTFIHLYTCRFLSFRQLSKLFIAVGYFSPMIELSFSHYEFIGNVITNRVNYKLRYFIRVAMLNFLKVNSMQCKDQELKQSEPKYSPQTKTGTLQIVKIQIEHTCMVKRMSSSFLKGGQSATQTELKVI